jgi:ABC-type sugar transport system substrate-binding protein
MPARPEELDASGATTVPTSSATTSPTAVEAVPSPARAIELVLGKHDPDETEAWKVFARSQAGLSSVKLKISAFDANDPKSNQAEMVREALARHPRALIVEPADPTDPKLAEAISEAERESIPIVFLNQPLAGEKAASARMGEKAAKSGGSGAERTGGATSSSSAHSVALIAAPPFNPSARELVVSAMRNAKEASLDVKDGALLVVNTASDLFVEDRARAIVAALKTAGIAPILEVRYAQEFDMGEKLLKTNLAANPKLVLVFATDSASSALTRQVIHPLAQQRPLVLACYSGEEHVADLSRTANSAAIAEFTPMRLIRKAITTAVALSQGKEIPHPIDIIMHDLPTNASILKSQIAGMKNDATEK